jgi:predicted lipase
MLLYDLFNRCLNVKYEKAGKSANYAMEIINGILYIYFQDSDSAEDWKNNLNFPSKAYKQMGETVWRVHKGFLKVWKELEPLLSNKIHNPDIHKIIIVGYSHGAALALLCHEYVWYNRPDLRNTLRGYGFGCPRVIWGNPSYEVRQRWENFLVIRNIDDLITHLPPAFMGYFHVGKMLTIGEKGKYSPIEAHDADNIKRELLAYGSGL